EPIGDVSGLKPTRRPPTAHFIAAHMSSLARVHTLVP
ncbi:MAG: hypothetical protein QOK26_887, partial [Pseudonocardiales bacterium]|nr:hypothetical protein [Pseudonocardiales bacterium]